MKAVSGKRLAALAEVKGWRLERINGSHHIYVMNGRIERVVIPIHGNQTLKIRIATQPDEDHSDQRRGTLMGS